MGALFALALPGLVLGAALAFWGRWRLLALLAALCLLAPFSLFVLPDPETTHVVYIFAMMALAGFGAGLALGVLLGAVARWLRRRAR